MKISAIILILWAGFTAAEVAAEAAWPAYAGPDGTAAALPYNAPLVGAWVDARVVWRSADSIPNGMAGDARKAPNAKAMISGGYGSPILVDGRVYLQYSIPSGPPCEETVRRLGEAYRDKYRVEADDYFHAFDAETGSTVWRTHYSKTSLNMQSFTKAGPSMSCCYGDGRIFGILAGGYVVAMDAGTGKKLWSVKTRRHERLEALRKAVLEMKALAGFNRDYTTSPRVVGGVLIVNDTLSASEHTPGMPKRTYYYDIPSNLVAHDPETGAERWHLPGGIMNGGQFVVWRNDGKEWLVAPGEDRVVRCLDPDTGALLWSIEDTDGQRVFVGGDILIVGAGKRKANPCIDGYRMTAAGATRIWSLTGHGRPDHVAVDNGVFYFYGSRILVCCDLATGRVLATAPAVKDTHSGTLPVILGARLIGAGSDSNQLHLYTSNPADFRLLDDAIFPHAHGYNIRMLPALYDGRMYFRGHRHLICMDLRDLGGEKRQAVDFDLPGGMLDDGEAYRCHLRLRGGRLRGGWARRASRSYYVETDGITVDAGTISGRLRMETPNGAYEPFELVLTNRTPEAMSGAIATVVRPFAKPRALGGQVTVGTWDKKWMPPCDHVLYLHDGACDRGDTRKALFMFVTVENGAVVRVQGTAPRVVKSWFLARHDLNLEGQRLAGTVTVLHRPDKWSWPLVESGRTAAARYSIDVDVANPGKARTYTGTWGVEWEDRRPLNARIIPDTECPQ